MNSCIEATLNDFVEVKRTKFGRKTELTNRVFIDYWDGTMDGKSYGYPEVMAFPILSDNTVAHWHTMGEWHGLEDGKPNWPEYLNDLNAFVPGNYGDIEIVNYE